ncbi:MAG: hypothetical protein COX43_01125 [Parcubacteria group bacterium CG23_combo_of_CG06-09_8_20_14_all_35_9]|nr:MAG: hypothetical protein COX43_01125 [Parcubacteria group bacterium CG23_combo_of_CG06-09_8_20_14_all_35_9]
MFRKQKTFNLADKKTLIIIKEKLLEEKDRLERELKQFAEKNIHNKEDYETRFPDYGSKDDENAAEVAVFGDRLSLERRLEVSLRDAKNALERVAKGTYGVCKHCGRPIDLQRLLARPTSSSCINCKKSLKGES